MKELFQSGVSIKAHILFWLMTGTCLSVRAGGGGQNLLLLVNPGDEHQVRIAAEYQRLRHIPDGNIVFIEPRQLVGFYRATEADTATGFNYVETYLKPIVDHIIANALRNQIDYISWLGQPFRMTGLSGGAANAISHDYALTYLNALVGGTTPEDISRAIFPRDEITASYTEGANEALIHTNDDLYVGTTLAFTGLFGNSPDDVISNLQRTASADGTRPAGTIYFAENDNIRSNTRESQWPATQAGLTARGISFVQEFGVSGNTPLNRTDVRGAVIGAATYTIPNGSTYLPGSWADSLTSSGSNFDTRNQTKAAELIHTGAGGSSGTVIEPYAISARFPHSHIFLYSADGSTIGEAFYKSSGTPLLQLMLGDPLGQPYADVPTVVIDSGPAEDATVSSNVPVTVSASLSDPNLATGIDRIDLYIDGKMTDTMPGSNATFNVDTTALSDGRHELRFVAVNNAAAQSQNHLLRHVNVDNDGRSVSAGSDVDAGTSASVNIPVSSVAGSSTVDRIELRHIGHVVGQLAAGAGSINLDVTPLAFGDNTLVPVAVCSDGAEVAGNPITVSRAPTYLTGTAPLAPRNRQYGILGEYFVGQGGASISASTFTGTPDVVVSHAALFIGVYDGTNSSLTRYASNEGQLNDVDPNPLGSVTNIALVDQLSARYTGRFEVETSGEHSFFLYKSNDSMQLSIDGQPFMNYDNRSAGLVAHYAPSIFLDAGEHTLELLTANLNTGSSDGFFDVGLYVRKPDGLTQIVDNTFVYQFVDRPAPRIVGYWRHDETGASEGSLIGTVVNVADPGTIDGDGITSAVFSTNIPGPAIFDPIAGVKRPNEFALNASNSNARIKILNDPALDVGNGGDHSFTIEFFLKIEDEHPGYNAFLRRLFSGPNPDSSTNSDRHAWQVDFNHGASTSFGTVRSRWDLPGIPPPDYSRSAQGDYVYVDTDGATGNPADYTLASGDPADEGDGINDDTTWHHVAMIFDEPAGVVRMYTDYQQDGTVTIQGPFSHPPANLEYGSTTSGNRLLFDEVRYTEGILDETLFLRASTFTPIEAWRIEHFGIAEDDGDAANLADSNGDKIVNLIAYAFGLSPYQDATSLLPQPMVVGNDVIVNFDEPPSVENILYGALFSTDLHEWFSIPDTGSGTNHIFTIPFNPDPALFIRLQVTAL
ncbi:MAG: hypothetical protein K9M45_01915 [Kiritimatiellales bacterium]|nr:hypothetical protein [Kiritimatiellales bacterium]